MGDARTLVTTEPVVADGTGSGNLTYNHERLGEGFDPKAAVRDLV